MRELKSTYILIILLILVNGLSAQSKKYKAKERNAYWDAETSYLEGDYKTAIESFKKLESADPQFYELFYKIGNSYFLLKQYDKALPYLRKGAKGNIDGLYSLAFIKLYKNEIDSAAFFINRFVIRKENKVSNIREIEINQLRNNIAHAGEFVEDIEPVNIINLGEAVNTNFDEYVPLISSEENLLIFTSKRATGDSLDPYGNPYEDVYFARSKEGNGKNWLNAALLEGNVNTKKHDACVGLSPDGNTLYIFRTNKNIVAGDLYESLYKKGKWTTPIRMSDNINGFESIEPSASVSLDGSTFYFSSNRKGGYGGFDIYRVKKLPNGEWSLPLNMGPSINTPLDEDAPFIHPNNKTLYFSSKGHKNMGGYDIFKSELIERKWTVPENLGMPTNSTKDDIYFTISANEKHGYYSSDKEGGFGGQDLYLIDYLEKNLRQSVISAKVLLNGKPVSADITLFEVESSEVNGVYSPNPANGKFIFLVNPDKEYKLLIEGDHFETYSEIIQFSVEDLLQSQYKLINLNGTKR